jgi:hypothetical protein
LQRHSAQAADFFRVPTQRVIALGYDAELC